MTLRDGAENPFCACGHARSDHHEEQPYACFGVCKFGAEDCPCEGFQYPGAVSEGAPEPDEHAKRVGRIVQEEITALLEEHGFKHNKGHRTAEVVARLVKQAQEDYASRRVASLEKQVEGLRAALRNLMKALEPELTGRPKNVPKSSWAEQWDLAEAALATQVPTAPKEKQK